MSHASMASTAERLIEKNGREVVFIKENRTAADSSKPWSGPATPEGSTKAKAVELTFSIRQMDGDRLRPGDKVFLVAAKSGVNLTEYNRLVDGSDSYGDLVITLYKPGVVEIVYEVRARR